jgi:hypothetical protein
MSIVAIGSGIVMHLTIGFIAGKFTKGGEEPG